MFLEWKHGKTIFCFSKNVPGKKSRFKRKAFMKVKGVSKIIVDLFQNYWKNSHQLQRTKNNRRSHTYDRKNNFSKHFRRKLFLENIFLKIIYRKQKSCRINLKIFEIFIHFFRSSVNRIVPEKNMRWLFKIGKRCFCSKSKGHFDWDNVSKKVAVTKKNFKGVPFTRIKISDLARDSNPHTSASHASEN